MLSAEKILAIPENDPELLFSAPEKIADEYRALAMQWHPDRNREKSAAQVAAHINRLHDVAKKKAAGGIWYKRGVLELTPIKGKTKRILYKKKHTFELGEMVYGQSVIAFILDNQFADLFHSARKMIRGIEYKDSNLKKEFTKYMPEIVADFETTDGKCVLVIKKPQDTYLLSDVLLAAQPLDPRHVGWMINSITNIACFFRIAGITHNALSIHTMFVSPSQHMIYPLGGWWYATKMGAKMNALPDHTIRYAPPDIVRAKMASHHIDTTLIRVMGREILGDATGMLLAHNASIPKVITDYLRRPALDNAISEYQSWKDTVLPAAFGKPRFVKLEVNESAIFKE